MSCRRRRRNQKDNGAFFMALRRVKLTQFFWRLCRGIALPGAISLASLPKLTATGFTAKLTSHYWPSLPFLRKKTTKIACRIMGILPLFSPACSYELFLDGANWLECGGHSCPPIYLPNMLLVGIVQIFIHLNSVGYAKVKKVLKEMG